MTAMHNPFFDVKFAVTLSLAIPAIIVSLHMSRPEALMRGWAWLLLLPAGLLAVAIGSEAMMAPAMPMTMRLMGRNSRYCMTAIPAMSLPLLATHCTDDSPLFVATWYTMATMVVTAIGAALGARVLRY